MANVTALELQAQLTAMNATLTSLGTKLQLSAQTSADQWRMGSAIFIFLMQLGFSLLEAGTVRFKNTRNIMLKNVLDTCVCAASFWSFGYAIGFGSGSSFIGWNYGDEARNDKVAFFGSMDGVNGIDFFFQFTFAATATTIIAGAVAERTHLTAYLFYNFFLSSLIYPVVAHVIWSRNGLLSADKGIKILGTNGILDNAGSMVVHVTGGVTSLVGAWMVGPRIGRFDIDGNIVPFKSHSVVYMAAGTIILWVGFYGFNSGSVSLGDKNPDEWIYEVARVAVNTTACAAFAGFTCFAITFRRRDPAPEDTFNAVIGGLVSACATSSLVQPYAAAIIGCVSGVLYLVGVWCMKKLRIDDVVMAVPVHLFCGSWGALANGFFATDEGIRRTYSVEDVYSKGIFYGGNGKLLGIQILGLLFVYAWVGLTSFILFFGLDVFGLLRVKRQEEEVGLDVAFHGGEDTIQDEEGHQVHMKRFLNRAVRRRLGVLAPPSFFRMFGRDNEGGKGENLGAGYGGIGAKKEVWYKALETTPFGYYSFAMYEANYIMEDIGQVEASSSGVYVGVHDGHGGTEAAEFLKEHMFENLKEQFVQKGGGVSADALRAGFGETEYEFGDLVRKAFEKSPHLATVGACSVSCLITTNALWVANVGDCRAVLGQVRRTEEGSLECRALQLSVDHNLADPVHREKYISEHPEDPDIVVEKRGFYKVKGKLSVTRSFGDMYLKSDEFNRDPLFARFRIPEPFQPPLLTAEPNVSVRLLSPHDSFVIVASDGLFDLLSNQEAVDIVASSPKKDVARKLIRAALHRAAERHEVTYQDLLRMPSGERRAHHDDMTVVVFYFDHETRMRANRDDKWEIEATAREGQSTRELMERKVQNMGDVDVVGTYHGGNDAKDGLEKTQANGNGYDAV